jgi:hypothetical protein
MHKKPIKKLPNFAATLEARASPRIIGTLKNPKITLIFCSIGVASDLANKRRANRAGTVGDKNSHLVYELWILKI